jgi:hypothetical protein
LGGHPTGPPTHPTSSVVGSLVPQPKQGEGSRRRRCGKSGLSGSTAGTPVVLSAVQAVEAAERAAPPQAFAAEAVVGRVWAGRGWGSGTLCRCLRPSTGYPHPPATTARPPCSRRASQSKLQWTAAALPTARYSPSGCAASSHASRWKRGVVAFQPDQSSAGRLFWPERLTTSVPSAPPTSDHLPLPRGHRPKREHSSPPWIGPRRCICIFSCVSVYCKPFLNSILRSYASAQEGAFKLYFNGPRRSIVIGPLESAEVPVRLKREHRRVAHLQPTAQEGAFVGPRGSILRPKSEHLTAQGRASTAQGRADLGPRGSAQSRTRSEFTNLFCLF